MKHTKLTLAQQIKRIRAVKLNTKQNQKSTRTEVWFGGLFKQQRKDQNLEMTKKRTSYTGSRNITDVLLTNEVCLSLLYCGKDINETKARVRECVVKLMR